MKDSRSSREKWWAVDPNSDAYDQAGGIDGAIVTFVIVAIGLFAGAIALWRWTPQSDAPAFCIFGGIGLMGLGALSLRYAQYIYTTMYGPRFEAESVAACLVGGLSTLGLMIISQAGIGAVYAAPYMLVFGIFVLGCLVGVAGLTVLSSALRPRRAYRGALVGRRYAVDSEGYERNDFPDPEGVGYKAWIEFRGPKGLDRVRATSGQYNRLLPGSRYDVSLKGNRILSIRKP